MFTKPRIIHPDDEQAEQIHTSALLRTVIADAPPDVFTLEWLIDQMPRHSFGVILLFLAFLSLVPIVSVIAGLLTLVLGLQIILGYHSPVLPRKLIAREFPSSYLGHLDRHAIPLLVHLEKAVRPRWPDFLIAARRFAALIGVILISLGLLIPVPFVNVPPAFIVGLMALAYIEHDGLLLMIAMIFSIAVLTGVALLVFGVEF